MNIAILGAGAFGQALGKILTDNQHQIFYYDPQLFPDCTLEQATLEAQAIVITIPSSFLPDFIQSYPSRLKQLPTILASKGLANIDLFQDFAQFSVLSGPAFAKELMRGTKSTMTASAPIAKQLFENSQISIELSDDALGLVLCGTLKNVYAIGAGYLHEAKNEVATYICRAHNEMRQYLVDHGAQGDSAEEVCGLGDLILSCINADSRNCSCGAMLREHKTLSEIRETLGTIEGLSAISQVDTESYPLIHHIKQLVDEAAR